MNKTISTTKKTVMNINKSSVVSYSSVSPDSEASLVVLVATGVVNSSLYAIEEIPLRPRCVPVVDVNGDECKYQER